MVNRYNSSDKRGSVIDHCQNRQRQLDGIVVWYFDHVMGSLPLMLQAALLLFGCSLSRYLWDISIAVALVLGVTLFGLAFYLFIVVSGAVSGRCPNQTPGSRVLHYLGQKVYSIPSALRNRFKESGPLTQSHSI
jgi:multisubunit Na+/H+ antiporter MnhC subunit